MFSLTSIMNLWESIVNLVEEASGFYFLFELALILFAVKLMGHLSTKIGQPSVLGKLLVGIILGPTLLNIIHPNSLISKLAENYSLNFSSQLRN